MYERVSTGTISTFSSTLFFLPIFHSPVLIQTFSTGLCSKRVKVAVDGLSLKVQESQILALLGKYRGQRRNPY